ncbi:phosphoadenylyl-sulfate reductase [bacterium]|nr:phosphoadenylyl-sulfate reductase [bacterium]
MIGINKKNDYLGQLTVLERLKWAWENYSGSLAMTSSFQTQSVPFLHMVSQAIPEIPILFLDTGFHFTETLLFRDFLRDKYQLNIINVKPEIGHQDFKSSYGNLYLTDPDLCCHINKVAPLQKELNKYDAWITGVRSEQTSGRAKIKMFNVEKDRKIKLAPLLDWTKRDIWTYHNQNDLPMHPLFLKGYMSIGCAPCTRPATDPNDERSGRWADSCKTECGIHTSVENQED